MAELRPIPFPQLLERVLTEPARQQTLFDLPLRKIWRPRPGLDLSVDVHGDRAQTPVGPAAGPHAQLAQNIVLAWAAGSRVIELKTVQILDELRIPRPCIDAATVGYNVEWSQELRLEQSLREYVAGWMLIRILRELDPLGLGAAAALSQPVLELSVGYDLAGLKNVRMHNYLRKAQRADALVDELRALIPNEQRRLRDVDYRGELVSCVTLSTFHGCPPGEIEAIARYLIDEIGVDVIVKLNPTLLGYDEVAYLLHDRMGYHDLRPKRAAFDGDIAWDEAIALGTRLQRAAAVRGRSFGVKMTNTLVVENHRRYFSTEEMYLSGPPLHVLAMHCAERWRAAFGASVPLSFSGGIDQHNFADAVACDFVPVTTCTDLLRAGGYGRLGKYLTNLEEAMTDVGATDRDELIVRRCDQGAEAVRQVLGELRDDARSGGDRERALDELEARLLAAYKARLPLRDAIAQFSATAASAALIVRSHQEPGGDPTDGLLRRIVAAAGVLNGHALTAGVTGDPRYAAAKNGKPPRKVGSKLALLDCLSCDKCVPVCPNDANFAIETPLEEIAYDDLLLDENGAVARIAGGLWRVRQEQQWANFADACNECGNCDIFCPEDGGPYLVKARYFGSASSFDASPALDGLVIERDADAGLRARARISGRACTLSLVGGAVLLDDGVLRARFDPISAAVLSVEAHVGARGPHRLSGALFLTLRALIRGALDPRRVNAVSAALPGVAWPQAAAPL
jgi:putative selenate reductase